MKYLPFVFLFIITFAVFNIITMQNFLFNNGQSPGRSTSDGSKYLTSVMILNTLGVAIILNKMVTNQKKQSELELLAEQDAGYLTAVVYGKEKFLQSMADSFMTEVVNDIFIPADRREHYKRLFYIFSAIGNVETAKTILKNKRNSN